MPRLAGRDEGIRGHSSVGRALEWHSRGRGFDSPWLHQLEQGLERFQFDWNMGSDFRPEPTVVWEEGRRKAPSSPVFAARRSEASVCTWNRYRTPHLSFVGFDTESLVVLRYGLHGGSS